MKFTLIILTNYYLNISKLQNSYFMEYLYDYNLKINQMRISRIKNH